MPLPDDPGQLDRVAAAFRALGHPTRLQILDALSREAELSPTQLVDRLSTAPGLANVAYHTRELAGLGLLSPAGLRPARGALEHFYRLSSHGQELIEMVDGLSVNTSDA
jgi:DNA-binding transcriptional ArsR family regulator